MSDEVCTHHWVIEEAEKERGGKKPEGVCKKCGAKRQYNRNTPWKRAALFKAAFEK